MDSRRICALLAISLVLCLPGVALGQDFCAWPTLANKTYWAGDWFAAQACFGQVPLDMQRALGTLDVLNQLVTLYSFTDIAQNSGAPWNMNVNLRSGLRAIGNNLGNKLYENEYDFHTDITKLFNQLYDAHTLYRFPAGWAGANFVRPFSIEPVVGDNATLEFYLRQGPMGDDGDDTFRTLFGFNPKKYVNRQVVAIADRNPVDYFLNIANRTVGNYKDPQVRFNQLMRVKGWGFVPLIRFSLSQFDPYDTLLLDGGEMLITTNMVVYPGGLNGSQMVEKNKFNCTFCTPAPKSAVGGVNDVQLYNINPRRPFYHKYIPDPHQEIERVFEAMSGPVKVTHMSVQERQFKEAAKSRRSATPQLADKLTYIGPDGRNGVLKKQTKVLPVVKGDASALKVIATDDKNETTYFHYDIPSFGLLPVFKLRTFAPSSENQSLGVLATMLADAAENQFETVLIDVSKNGGGIICLSDLLLASLAPSWAGLNITSPSVAYGVYDFRRNQITDLLMSNPVTQEAVINSTIYVNTQTRKEYPMDDLSWYYARNNYVRGGIASNYTTKAYFPNECESYAEMAQNQTYWFKNVLILTDGTCGSACSLFTSQMITYQQGVIISHGGIPSYGPQDTSSFAGGNVLDWPTFAATFNISGISNDPRYPQSFPSSAGGRFNWNEMYPTLDATTPREFLKLPADYHLYEWDAVYNDDIATAGGRAALANLYAGAIQAL